MFGLFKKKPKINEYIVRIKDIDYPERAHLSRMTDTSYTASERKEFKKMAAKAKKEAAVFKKNLPSIIKKLNPAASKSDLDELMTAVKVGESPVIFLSPTFPEGIDHLVGERISERRCGCNRGVASGCCSTPINIGLNGILQLTSLPSSLQTGFWWGEYMIRLDPDEWTEADVKWAEETLGQQRKKRKDLRAVLLSDEDDDDDDEW